MAKAIKAALIAVIVVVAVMYGASALLHAFTGTAISGSSIAMAAAVTFVGSLVQSAMGSVFNKGFNNNNANLGSKTTSRQAIGPRQIVYGTCRTGGTITHIETKGENNHKLCMIVVVSGHPIAGFSSVRFGDETLTTSASTISGETVFRVTNSDFVKPDNDNAFTLGSLARFTFHDGTQTARDGLAAATLGNTSIPTTHKYIDCAYFYFELIFDAEAMSSIPPISYTLKGKNIYDPRTGQAATTDLQRENPALQIRDYLTDTTYGMRAESSEINDTTNAGGFAAAANTCDQDVTLADGSSTEKRYKSSGFSTFTSSGESLIGGIQSSMAARVTYTNGKFNIFAGAAQTPTLTVTDDDMLAPMQVDTGSGSSKGQLFNQVKAIFVDGSQSFKANETPIVSDSAMLSQDTPSGASSNNFRKTLECQLPFTTSNTMAQRVAKIQLKYQRKTMTIQVNVGMKYVRLQPNDFVYVTNSRMGWNQKMFEVLTTSMALNDDGSGAMAASINLSLLEISSDVWDFATNEYTAGIGEGSVINTGSFAQAAPTIGTLTQRAVISGPHTTVDILVNWTNQTGDAVQGTEVQYKLNGESDYAVAGVAGKGQTKSVIQNVVVGSTYNVRLRHFTFDNVYSGVSSVANITIAEADTLSAPSSVSATTGKPFFIELKWTNPSNTNLRAVEVHASSTSGFTPSTGTLVNTYYGDVSKSKRVVLGKSSAFGFDYGTTYYFRLRSINALGTATTYTAEVSGSFTKAASVDIDSISANQLTAGTIDAEVITVTKIDAAEISAGELNINRLPSAVVFTSELVDGSTIIDGSNIQTGEITLTSGDGTDNLAHIKGGKTSYEDTSNEGFFMGFNASNHPSFNIGTTTDYLKYDQSNGLVLRGSLTADDIASGGTLSGVNMSIGSNNAIFKATSSGIQLGHATFSSAPFRVNTDGALTATSVTVTGSVTATSGAIAGASVGPFTTASDKIYLGTGTFNNSNTGFYADDSGQFSLKDRLSFDGTDLTVAGTVNASSFSMTGGALINAGDIRSDSGTFQVVNNVLTLADDGVPVEKFATSLESTNYVAGSAGWKILKSGSAEFNGVVLSRQLLVDSGTFSPGNQLGLKYGSGGVYPRSTNPTNDPSLALDKTFFIETATSHSGWAGSNQTFIALVGAVPSSEVVAWNPDVSGFPSDIQWGGVCQVIPIVRWSGNARVWIKLEFYTRNVYSFDVGFAWKLYKVT